MIEPAGLFSLEDREARTTGVLPSQALRAAISSSEIQSHRAIDPTQVQPASLDLRLSDVAYRVNASFLPGPKFTVNQKLERLAMHSFSLADGAILERGCVYIIPLQERLRLRSRTSAMANPKSSVGRLDVFARVITDNGVRFDSIEERYSGPLYVEIAPRTFSIKVREGSRLVQLRIRRGSPPASEQFHKDLHEEFKNVSGPDAPGTMGRSLAFTVDVKGSGIDSIIGYRAKKFSGLIDIDQVAAYDPQDYWEPVRSRNGRGLVLDPEDFYILASKESVVVPPDCAAEMLAYDTLVGEFRVHYAGFFDPGFGHESTGGHGTRAVLEVRSHEVPFLVEDGQIVGRLAYERLAAAPDTLYGAGVGSYQKQGLALAKHFKPWS